MRPLNSCDGSVSPSSTLRGVAGISGDKAIVEFVVADRPISAQSSNRTLKTLWQHRLLQQRERRTGRVHRPRGRWL